MKKQQRRSVSLRRPLYEQLHAHCESNGISMSSFVEARIQEYLDSSGTVKEITTERNTEEIVVGPRTPAVLTADQIFTF